MRLFFFYMVYFFLLPMLMDQSAQGSTLPSCTLVSRIYGHMRFLKDDRLWTLPKILQVEQTRVRPALEALYLAKITNAAEVSRLHDFTSRTNKSWAAQKRFLTVARNFDPPSGAQKIVMTPINKGLFKFTAQGQDWVAIDPSARPQKARYTQTVGLLAAFLKETTVPGSHIAQVNGKKYIVSEFVKGDVALEELPNRDFRQYIENRFAEGLIPEKMLDDAMAFQFFIGNADVNNENVVFYPGGLKVVDFDEALHHIVVGFEKVEDLRLWPLGYVLPQRYTKRFLSRLKKLTPSLMEDLLIDHLNADELRDLEIRRQIILADVRIRGAEAVWP